MKRTLLVVVAGATAAAVIPAQLSTAKASGPAIARASAPTASMYRNCKALNRVYPHGVGRYGARDHTSGDAGDELQAQQPALPPEQRTRPRQGRDRLREALSLPMRWVKGSPREPRKGGSCGSRVPTVA